MTKLTTIEGEALISTLNDFSRIQKQLISRFKNRYFTSGKTIAEEIQSILFMSLKSMPLLGISMLDSGVVSSNTLPTQNLNLLGKPRSGAISTLREEWQFTRHGEGILFAGKESKQVIDAHREVFNHSSSFDAWRLAQYFESLNCSEVVWKSNSFIADDDDELEQLLELLEQEHIVELTSETYRLYKLVG
ncbi:MAG: hypothetical protein AAF652_11595 [Cyanobacteria bacterium P01_C01_bin.72]